MSTARKQVEAAIIQIIADAEAQGVDGVLAAHRAFPGTPDTVLWGCWSQWDGERTEAWWQTVERSIDGEIIRNAVVAAHKDGGGA
ncbi:hypothetical protein [Methylobacterium haplocladii]|uniref:Uncharacterized protein n=1 Tax=Methylobacterium haplocladii TaxID=1176176 RepID=A0A512IQQ2_9HYPH|nr:hypothetical protein [Methylobacterium haplocladii]GEP00028.1 hypothetical protein MHA02_24150 [Methylobacterium haplocladii]GJD85744.1 hypothetical protein HPGCJGGD_3636 [Methylobacterium haplocladii]GLS59870.1 hypothetical protein GCM10007887_25430 [Methylobacterium haplocladii]